MQVKKKGRQVQVTASVLIAAPQSLVFQSLSDYDKWDELSPRIDESHVVGPDEDGVPLVYTLVEGCITFFCRRIERKSRLETWPEERILVTLVDGYGSFKHVEEEWRLQPADEATRVFYSMDMDADFWIPPLIGTWIIKRTLKKASLGAAESIEAMAAEDQEI